VAVAINVAAMRLHTSQSFINHHRPPLTGAANSFVVSFWKAMMLMTKLVKKAGGDCDHPT
jgi:hypothetical protein